MHGIAASRFGRLLDKGSAGFPGLDQASPTIRYGYAQDRSPIDNRRIDAVSPVGPLSLADMAGDYLAWLDHFGSFQPSREFRP